MSFFLEAEIPTILEQYAVICMIVKLSSSHANKGYSFNCVSKNYGLARQEIYTTLTDKGAKIERVQESQEKN